MASSLTTRAARILASAGLVGALMIPAATPVAAADPVVLRVGATQTIDSINPFGTAFVAGYEAYGLTYDLLVGFGPDAEPAPGFAESWERAADGKSWTFKIREGMKWSDGTPATAQDACFSFQINLDAIAAGSYIGLGYIDPTVGAAGVTKAECPDDQTMILTTSDPSERVLQLYVPILPKHIWGDMTYAEIGESEFAAPQVGSGPYQLSEWKTGEFAKFVRNPDYWGEQGAADEIVIQEFGSVDTLVQALKAGEIDYARGANADQFDALKSEPNIVTVAGQSNGWTELGFNSYGTGTGNTIADGGPSTPALQDQAFRDALGYAIDKELLLERLVLGYGDVGASVIPPVLKDWYVEPANPRTFDLALADQKLTAAGYAKDASGARLDKDGNVISLTLVYPNYDPNFGKAAEFIKGWYGEVGVKVTAVPYEESALISVMLPPEADPPGTAEYDLFIWTWSWSLDPSSPLEVFLCDAIGGSSDSMWCDPKFDELYAKQLTLGGDERHAVLDEIQQYWYDQAPYHILYYDDNLHAYRTDKFSNWQVQPKTGTPLFAYNTLNYTLLELAADASASPSAAPSDGASAAPATPTPSGEGDGSSTSGDNTLLIVGLVAVVAVVVVGLVLARRRGATEDDE